jgi:PAS domain S-box-containing protein
MEFIHPDDRELSEEETRRVFAGATVRAFENRVLCKDGSHKWIEWTATPVSDERVIYAVGRDVTDRLPCSSLPPRARLRGQRR